LEGLGSPVDVPDRLSLERLSLDRVGFIGFGEAGYHIAKGLRGAGLAKTLAYDMDSSARVSGRAREIQTELVDSNAGLAEACDVIFCAVTADQALHAAKQTAPFLTSRHFYCDVNSVSPKVKQAVGREVARSGARFVEAAMMAPVPPHGHKVPMLLGGEAAPAFVEILAPFGVRMEVVSTDQIGRAAAVKMFRSIVYKGLEALLFECVMGASHYGAEPRVFASLNESFPGVDFEKLADYMIGRVVVHGERRAREMEEVAATLQDLDIEPIMAEATVRRMDWAADLGLKARFEGEFPKSYKDVLDAIAAAPVK
jgi:3-hydroxyisobutyrate dehydrogenase-like beta-hydroxyacid dehydrogenase